MIYVKIMLSDVVITAEAHESPVFVRRLANGTIVRCSEQRAQGIVSADESTLYQLDGRAPLNLDNDYTAYYICMTEYEEIIADNPPDEEDTNPEIPDDGTEPLTRAELTEKVMALENELAAAKIVLGVE